MKNETIKTLLNHRSVRKYKETPIPEEIVTLIIQAGTRAATGGNLQMYSFLVVDEKEKLQLFEAELQPIIQSPPLIIIALLDLHRIKRWLEVNESQTPVLDRPAYFMLGLWDALIALHNVVISAESLGLGACYFGSILEFDIQKHFHTPEYVFPAGMITLGYPDNIPNLSTRLPLEAVIHKNQYRSFSDSEIRNMYEERERFWELVGDARKKDLAKQGIHNIPQALAIQRFSDDVTRERSEKILENIRKAGFNFNA